MVTWFCPGDQQVWGDLCQATSMHGSVTECVTLSLYKSRFRGLTARWPPLSWPTLKIGEIYGHRLLSNFLCRSIFLFTVALVFDSFAAKQLFQNLKQLFCGKPLKIRGDREKENWSARKVLYRRVPSKMAKMVFFRRKNWPPYFLLKIASLMAKTNFTLGPTQNGNRKCIISILRNT